MKCIQEWRVLAVVLSGLLFSATGHCQDKSQIVKVTFQNPPASAAVKFRLFSEGIKEGDKTELVKLGDGDQPLLPGNERIFESYPGLVWQIVDSEKNIQLALYVTGNSNPQIANIGELVAAIAPVTLKFNNTSDAPISVYQMDGKISTSSEIAGAYSNDSLSGSLIRIPGDKFRWKTSDGQQREFQLDSTATEVTLIENDKQSEQAKLVFTINNGEIKGLTTQGNFLKRTSDIAPGVLVLEDIPVGEIREIVPPENTPGPQPGSEWRILQNDAFYADYTASTLDEQEVDVKEVGTWFLPVTAVFKNDSTKQVKVYHVDIAGKLVPIMVDKDHFVIALERDQWVAQPAQPFHRYRVVDKKDSSKFAEFIVDNQPQQIFNVTDELLLQQNRE